ncbi:conserved hypothetical protein [Oleispira antarctica RB-8]|uniref:SrpA-related protein n=1 Tax=Oleispira antarctica RB-8 TaxID=698738 RepID=R4YK63_OLEAN|nr:conserved hypothetical protein [Oleispira antarctica RB-8]
MQIPTSAGMLANSVLPVTPTQGGLLSQVGETAGSTSFAPVEAVSNVSLSRSIPEQRPQPATAPENAGQPYITPVRVDGSSIDGINGGEKGAEQSSEQNGSTSVQAQSNENAERSENESKQQERIQEQQQQQDLELVRSLSQRDSEVHAHENAHSAVGGQYAGSANYSYQRGPDGVSYAVGGEVSIDVGVIPGNPAATLEKMQLVQRAALAPAEPSSQDRRVAALAAQQANQARAELATENRGTSSSDGESAADKTDKAENAESSLNVAKNASQGTADNTSQKPESQSVSNSENFQAANDRIAKINEIIVAISQNDTSKASGQLLDAVV